jgi:hypothetical protein
VTPSTKQPTAEEVDAEYEKSDAASRAEFISEALTLPGVAALKAVVPDAVLTTALSELYDEFFCGDDDLDEEEDETVVKGTAKS